MFGKLKTHTSQFHDCYETIYDKKDTTFEKIYSYLKNPDYLDYVYLNETEENRINEKKEKEDEEVDEEGFVMIKKKKKY